MDPPARWETHLLDEYEFRFRPPGEEEEVSLRVKQIPSTEFLGHSVWDVGIWSCNYVQRDVALRRAFASHARVLELGAGCGLLGIVAGCYGARVTATDLEGVMPLLRANIDAHEALVRQHGGSIVSETLEWGPGPAMPFDVVLGADLVYYEENVEPLVATLLRVCTEKTIVLLAHENRQPAVQRQALAALSPHFRYNKLDMKKEGGENFEAYFLKRKRS